jgi:hypothetical protein
MQLAGYITITPMQPASKILILRVIGALFATISALATTDSTSTAYACPKLVILSAYAGPDASLLQTPSSAHTASLKNAYAPSFRSPQTQTVILASLATHLVPETSLYISTPTGSMKPVFDENAILLVKPTPFAALKVGDIVVYQHPNIPIPVVHRLIALTAKGFLAKGDNNSARDSVPVTAQNYSGRVYGILYSNTAP